jgi:hypothetical protein
MAANSARGSSANGNFCLQDGFLHKMLQINQLNVIFPDFLEPKKRPNGVLPDFWGQKK